MNFEERISHRCGERGPCRPPVFFGNSEAADLMRDSGRRPLCFAKVVLEIGKRKIKWILSKSTEMYIRQKTETDPQKALRMFRFGFGVEYQKASKLADKQLPYGYREIYKAAVEKYERGAGGSPKRVSGPISSVRWRFFSVSV